MTKYYIDGEEVEAPVLTAKEKELAKKLSYSDFGSLENCGIMTTNGDDEWCTTGGYDQAHLIEWPNRHELGALLTSLQKKRVVIVDEEKLNGQTVTEIWFDCDTLASLSEDASDKA